MAQLKHRRKIEFAKRIQQNYTKATSSPPPLHYGTKRIVNSQDCYEILLICIAKYVGQKYTRMV